MFFFMHNSIYLQQYLNSNIPFYSKVLFSYRSTDLYTILDTLKMRLIWSTYYTSRWLMIIKLPFRALIKFLLSLISSKTFKFDYWSNWLLLPSSKSTFGQIQRLFLSYIKKSLDITSIQNNSSDKCFCKCFSCFNTYLFIR